METFLNILFLSTYSIVGYLLEYVVIFVAIMMDLVFGVKKAKKMGEARTSYGFRKTLEKICQYYGVMFFISVIDLLIIYVMNGYFSIQGFPFLSLMITLFICAIEFKSIYEKKSTKEKARIEEVAKLLYSIAKEDKNMDKLNEVIAMINKIKDLKESK